MKSGPDAAPRPQGTWIALLLKLVLLLNLFDALFTLVWVRTGLAYEANPLLRLLVSEHPLSFTSAKLALVSLGSWLLWRHRRQSLATAGILLAFVFYYLVLVYHLRYLRVHVLALLA